MVDEVRMIKDKEEIELMRQASAINDKAMGGFTNNYSSDMTRSIFYGTPNEEYKKIHELVLKASQNAIVAVKPGVKFSAIDNAARKVIEDGGMENTLPTEQVIT